MTSMGQGRFWAALLTCAIVVALLAATGASAAERSHFDTRVLARVPSPGYPADLAIGADGTIWTGSYFGAVQYSGPSKVFAFSPSGELLKTITVAGQDLSGTHAVAAFAMDAEGRLYVGDYAPGAGQPGRMVRFDPVTGAQETYATFPDIPVCSAAPAGADCAEAAADWAPGPDFAAFDAQGSLFVTDFQQGVIWRVPRGGGQAQVWLSDARLDGGNFGPSGLQFRPDGRSLLLAVSSTGGVPTASQGVVYEVALGSDGQAGPMREFWRSAPGDGPNGIAIAKSGNVYLTLTFAPSQVLQLSPTGEEIARTPAIPGGDPSMEPPFETPSGIHFDGMRLLVANIAYVSGDSSRHVIFDVWAGEEGAPLFRPALSSPQEPRPRIHLRVRPRRVHVRRPVRLRFHATADGHDLARVRICVRHRCTRTGSRGRAKIRRRFHKKGLAHASARKHGYRAGRATIRVVA